MAPRQIWDLTKKSVIAWRADHASSMGGALAYYTLFSTAPVLIIAIAVAGFFFGEEAARGEILVQLRGLLGDDGAGAVQGLLESVSEPAQGVIATLSSIALLVLGATTVFAELQRDLDLIWKAPPAARKVGLWGSAAFPPPVLWAGSGTWFFAPGIAHSERGPFCVWPMAGRLF